jgi:imidazolonepropionase-like amidohydrolase
MTREAARNLRSTPCGKLADLVVVGGDPYAFDTLAERTEGVWLGGRRAAGAA